MKKINYNAILTTMIAALLITLVILSGMQWQKIQTLELNQNDIVAYNDEHFASIQNQLEYSYSIHNENTNCNTNEFEIVDESQITEEMLLNRNGKIIVSKVIGKCINSKGDGVILNPCTPEADYISYRSVDGVKEDSIIVTYLLYNPDSSYTDDILYRFDYIVSENY